MRKLRSKHKMNTEYSDSRATQMSTRLREYKSVKCWRISRCGNWQQHQQLNDAGYACINAGENCKPAVFRLCTVSLLRRVSSVRVRWRGDAIRHGGAVCIRRGGRGDASIRHDLAVGSYRLRPQYNTHTPSPHRSVQTSFNCCWQPQNRAYIAATAADTDEQLRARFCSLRGAPT